mmetsp:Transcript_89205/g.195526  ORF Transcript_89205/g.195526 Transcript_89205/m.195526 type:complete len:99 (-) Transcript_89205:967-1263(-)
MQSSVGSSWLGQQSVVVVVVGEAGAGKRQRHTEGRLALIGRWNHHMKKRLRLTWESGRQMNSYSPSFASKVPCCKYRSFKVKRGPISLRAQRVPSPLN